MSFAQSTPASAPVVTSELAPPPTSAPSSASSRQTATSRLTALDLDPIFGRAAPAAPRSPARAAPAVQAPAFVALSHPNGPEDVPPPPYGTPEFAAPAYGAKEEPTTLPKYLFKYGFLFPPFWLIGFCVIFFKLEPAPEAECGKTAEEQAEEIAILRKAELRWAKRCLFALLALLSAVAIIILACFGARVGVFKRHVTPEDQGVTLPINTSG